MRKHALLTVFLLSFQLVFTGCALTGDSGQSSSSSQQTEAEKKAAADEEDKLLAEAEAKKASAPIPAGSPFAKLAIGMSDDSVINILGRPDKQTSYRTGKSWIPFAGRWLNDKRRQTWFYKNIGTIIMTQNSYSGQYKVLRIDYNANQLLN